jgi:integrase
VFFYDRHKRRKAVHLGRVSDDAAEAICRRIERFLNAQVLGDEPSRNDLEWLAKSGMRSKFMAAGLIESLPGDATIESPTLVDFLSGFMDRKSKGVKPATMTVWAQVVANLIEFMPPGIRLNQITAGHAKDFHAKLKMKGMKNSTISKRIGFCRQFMNDAVDWKLIAENPFAKVKASRPATKSNVFVDRDTIDRIMSKASLRWRVIIALSRYGGLRTPSETLSLKWSHIDWERDRMHIPECKVEHHEGRGVRTCPLFAELRTILEEAFEVFGGTSEFVVDADEYRQAAQTNAGWKNANLRTQFLKLLAKAGVSPWPRLFHSMRASRQTELQEDFPTHVVCSWIGNSEAIAKESYLLVTEDHFSRAISRPLADGKSSKASGSLEEKRVINPTQKASKRVINPTPQGGRTQHANSDSARENTRKTSGFRQLLLVLSAEDKGFELSPNSQGNQRNLASLVINPTQERHVDAWIRLVNALGYIDDERIIALAEHVENVRGIAEQNV